jgi:hypothetical protein
MSQLQEAILKEWGVPRFPIAQNAEIRYINFTKMEKKKKLSTVCRIHILDGWYMSDKNRTRDMQLLIHGDIYRPMYWLVQDERCNGLKLYITFKFIK